MYHFGDTWYKLLPNPIRSILSEIMKPFPKQDHIDNNPSALDIEAIFQKKVCQQGNQRIKSDSSRVYPQTQLAELSNTNTLQFNLTSIEPLESRTS